MEAKDLAKQEVREAITSEITKEGLFELKEHHLAKSPGLSELRIKTKCAYMSPK